MGTVSTPRRFLLPLRILFFTFLSLTLIVSCLIVGGGVLFVTSFLENSHQEDSCKVDSEVYQALEVFSGSWMEYFPGTYPSPTNSRQLSHLLFTRNGRSYYVRADYWLTERREPIFYVQTADSWPGTLLGIKGLFYTPTGTLPANSFAELTYLNENIYCYEIPDHY